MLKHEGAVEQPTLIWLLGISLFLCFPGYRRGMQQPDQPIDGRNPLNTMLLFPSFLVMVIMSQAFKVPRKNHDAVTNHEAQELDPLMLFAFEFVGNDVCDSDIQEGAASNG